MQKLCCVHTGPCAAAALLRFRDDLSHIFSWRGGEGEAFWGCWSQKTSQEPSSYSRTRCLSWYVETLGSGLRFNEIIIFKIYRVITSRSQALQRHLILLLKLLHARREAEIRMLIENQGPECRISCNYSNSVNFAA